MSANKLPIYLVLGEQTAVRGPQDSSPAEVRFFERNTYRLQLHAQRRNVEPGALSRFVSADFTGYAEFEASLGFLDAVPTGGKWKIKLSGGSFSDELAHNISAADLQTAIRALSGAGDVTVTNGNAANVYIIRPATAATDLTFVVESALVPLCAARVRKASDGSGNYTVVKLSKAYFATANTWTAPMPPVTTVSVQSVGSATKNTLQLITVPVGATGSFRLQHASVWTAPIEVTGLTPATVAAALNALYADGATSPRFAAYGTATGVQIECIGSLEKSDVPEFGIERLGQVALPIREAWFSLTSLPLELEVVSKTKVPMVFEIVGRDASGNEETLFQKTVDVFNVIHESDSSATVASVATSYVTVTTTADPEAPIQVGLRSQNVVLTGSGTVPTSGDYTQTFTHNLNTAHPVFLGFRRTSVSPEKWQQLTDNEFSTETVSVNATSLYMPVIPAEAGNVGSVKFYAINPAAGVWTNDHTHDTDEVNGTGSDSGKTLTEIIAELRADMPAEWPAVPGGLLTAASVKAEKLDLGSVIAALFGNATFMANLRELAEDSAFVRTFIEALSTSATFTESRALLFQKLFADVPQNPDSQTALLSALTSSQEFLSTIYAAVISALSGGAVLDAHVFTMPDLDFAFPGVSTATLSAKKVRFFRGLPFAYQTTTDGGNASALPGSPTTGTRLTLTADVTTSENEFATARRFKSGTVVVWNGYFWQPLKVISVSGTDRFYPLDCERVVMEEFLDDARFPAASVATFAGTLQTQLQSPDEARIRGRWTLLFEAGTGGSDSGATNLSTMTWQTLAGHVMSLGPALAFTPIVVTVTRPATGDLTFKVSINGKETTVTPGTAITSGNVAIRVRLTQFDPENATPPLGSVLANCIKPGGKIALL